MIHINNLLQAALETFPNFVIVDNKGTVVYLNGGYANLLGTTKENAIGKPVNSVIPDTRLSIVLKTGKEEIGSVMKLFDHSKNEEVTVVCNRIPIMENGEVIGALAATTISNIFDVAKLYEEIEAIKSENRKYQKKLDAIKQSMHPLEKIIGKSKATIDIKKLITDYADSNLSILITGETGVGKEVFAKAIHQVSNRALNNYVKINCAAIPQNLLESELFGYAEGAFTGASKGGKIGKFELADKGTLLLDEIGEMPIDLQVKLLRVLQEKEFEKIGGLKAIKFNTRIICSTNQNIEDMVANGQFRQDLFYRINIIEIYIPPLRERLDDIEPLCLHFIKRINQENGTKITGINKEVINMLYQYHWPGNVRELEHVIDRAAVICKSGELKLNHLTFFIERQNRRKRSVDSPVSSEQTLRDQTQKTEKEAILQALRQVGGNKTKAAELLHIDRSRLYSKLKKYGIR